MKNSAKTIEDLNIPQFADNQEQSLNFFNTNGFHIEKNILTNFECENIIYNSKKFSNSINKSFEPEMQPHQTSNLILNFMKNRKITSIVRKIISKDMKIFGLQSNFFYGIPGTTGSAQHQDGLYTSPDSPDAFISVWIPLVDINDETMGNLYVYKKRDIDRERER